MRRKPAFFTKIYLALLFGCTVWILPDQFVIPRELAPVQQAEAAISAEQALVIAETTVPTLETEAPPSEPQITLSETRIFDTTVHIAEIRIPNASWLRPAIANDTYGRTTIPCRGSSPGASTGIQRCNG